MTETYGEVNTRLRVTCDQNVVLQISFTVLSIWARYGKVGGYPDENGMSGGNGASKIDQQSFIKICHRLGCIDVYKCGGYSASRYLYFRANNVGFCASRIMHFVMMKDWPY